MFKHAEARFRPNKLSARAKKLHLVGYNTKNQTHRLWDPADPMKITNSAEVSCRKKNTRDVVSPKEGCDPFQPNKIVRPGIQMIATKEEVAPAAP